MKIFVSLIAWLLLPVAAVAVAWDVAKAYVEEKML